MSDYEKSDEDTDDINAEEFVDEALNEGDKKRSKEELRDLFVKLFAMVFSDNKNESAVALDKINKLREKYKLTGNDVLELVGMRSSSDEADAKLDDMFEQLLKAHRKQADILIELAAEAELFRTPDGQAYAHFAADGDHRETWAIRSGGFTKWLRYRFHQTQKYAPNRDAIETAKAHLEATTQFDPKTETRPIYTRVAAHEGKIYLDLADTKWRAVEVDAHGWRLAENAPVRFRRSPGMTSLPMPQAGGSLDPLRKLLNIADEDFILVVAWLLAVLRGVKPYPILALTGPPGSAKSTLVKLLRDIIDPNAIEPGALPREVRDLVISGTKRFVMGYDNLSDVTGAISDALCRLSTGGGFSTRALYSDDEEMVFSDTRPIILAGIEDVVGKPDLSERIIGLTLTEINVSRRKLESSMLAEYEQARPAILGALLDIVAHGLRQLPHTPPAAEKPRMADFAHWMAAAETAHWPVGAFAKAYANNRAAVAAMAVESEAVAQAVIALIAISHQWIGNAKDLLVRLADLATPETVKGRDWPRTPKGLSGKLRSATPMLRSAGIEVTPPRDTDKTRTWSLRRVLKAPDPRARQTGETTARTAQPPESGDFPKDSNGLGSGGWEGAAAAQPPQPPEPPEPPTATARPNPLKTKGLGGEGGQGGLPPTLSGSEASRPPRAIGDSPEDRYPDDSDRICSQCAAGGEPLATLTAADGRTVLLHPQCRRFWLKANPQPEGSVLAAVTISEISVSDKLPWSTPTITEVTDPAEAAAIRAAIDGSPAICAGPSDSLNDFVV